MIAPSPAPGPRAGVPSCPRRCAASGSQPAGAVVLTLSCTPCLRCAGLRGPAAFREARAPHKAKRCPLHRRCLRRPRTGAFGQAPQPVRQASCSRAPSAEGIWGRADVPASSRHFAIERVVGSYVRGWATVRMTISKTYGEAGRLYLKGFPSTGAGQRLGTQSYTFPEKSLPRRPHSRHSRQQPHGCGHSRQQPCSTAVNSRQQP